ncbi:MAG: putative baseplate assembly protein, partial [Cyanobacteria bacterium J06632_19]
KLPKPNLDDRDFNDLVDECLLRIPRYCPEWTNYNPSDPGVTLVELFAWLTDQMLLRFNQLPLRNYITFLELLGIRLQAPVPAQTNITFYLTTALEEEYTIAAGTEVATERTDTEEAIVFSTENDLTIGNPSLRHFLSAETVEDKPEILRDRFTNFWSQQPNGEWEGRELNIFEEQPSPGNCFYIVFDSQSSIEGNVVAITFKGEAATSIGINPENPPLIWEAWNGVTWESVLLEPKDDLTKGFSFSNINEPGDDTIPQADVILHLPLRFPATNFITYRGRWLRCVYNQPEAEQAGYSSSPRIVGLSLGSIGGTVLANQSSVIEDELVGESDGTPGQTFQLQGFPVLSRQENERILVTPPSQPPQLWQEVTDFAQSSPEDYHYIIDDRTGTIQFGPLIKEPSQLKQQTLFRAQTHQILPGGSSINQGLNAQQIRSLERQYGKVPPRGSVISITRYRTGGGSQGNVQQGTVTILKTAVPYVENVVNHIPGRYGTDAESLEDAVLRVPGMLRTRDRAVTAEDFEFLAIRGSEGRVARAHCLSSKKDSEAGKVRLLIVPQANTDGIFRGEGLRAEQLILTPDLKDQIKAYLDERRLLGVQVSLEEPEYVGVSIRAEVALEPQYNNFRAQEDIIEKLRISLYQFFNPLTGGSDGKGWPLGRPVYQSDVIKLFQQIPGIRYLGVVQLFELRKQENSWVRNQPQEPVIDPGSLGLICSWANSQLRSSHVINLIP